MPSRGIFFKYYRYKKAMKVMLALKLPYTKAEVKNLPVCIGTSLALDYVIPVFDVVTSELSEVRSVQPVAQRRVRFALCCCC